MATARQRGPARIHSMPTLPLPAPTSQSSCPGPGPQRGQGQRPDLAAGELPVALVGAVGQPGDLRQDGGRGIRLARQRDHGQVGERGAARCARRVRAVHLLLLAAQVLEHRQLTATPAPVRQQRGQRGRRAAVAAQHDDQGPWLHGREDDFDGL